jgi:predicted ATP-binding protein involved in virulence
MKSIPIYIKNLKLKNIRTFGEVELDFELKDGTLPQWTIILGDNGIGKSTLLQSVAWMRPYLPYTKEKTPADFKPAPSINDAQNELLISLVRKNAATYQDTSYITATFQAGKELQSKTLSTSKNTCDTKIDIDLDNKGELSHVRSDLIMEGETFYNNEVLIYAYSASRNLGKQNIDVDDLVDMIPGFINEKTVLYDAQEILHTVNYAALGSDKSEQEKYQKYLSRVKEMLISLLPDFHNLDDVEITTPKLVNNKLKPGEVLITTKHGEKIPFDDFSLGYRTVVSWSVDLSWRLFNKYPTSSNPLAETAIVLIDEIDLHLHPTWQIDIIANLSKHFPNIQFIATAHSPLMVQSALSSNFAILKSGEDGVEIINEPVDVDGWRVDQILTSEYFGLRSARGIEYANLLEKRSKLIAKDKLSAKEKNELQRITTELSAYPSGENSAEIEERKVIRQIISDYKKTGKVITI